jgi:hypothetical protein
VTKEQTIVLGFLAAAFVAGWIVHAVTGRRDRHATAPAAAPAPRDDGRLEQAIEDSRQELDAAVRSYLTAVAASIRSPAAEPAPAHAAEEEGPPDERPALSQEVTAALTDDAANESMLSVLKGDHGAGLSERELDLADWGFAYGVAWARARERRPAEARDAIAQDALRAAGPVFRVYAADASWERPDPPA